MELTIVQPDALNSAAYTSFTPAVVVEQNKQNIHSILLLAAAVIGMIVLFIILKKISERKYFSV